MPPVNDCLPSLQFCAIQVARLDANGVPTPGANNLYVSDKMGTLTATPVYREGDAFESVSGCGDLIVSFKDQNRLQRITAELGLLVPDPQLTEMLAGGVVISNEEAPTAGAGYAAPELLVAANPNGVSVECWTKRISPDGAQDATWPWWHWVFPRLYFDLGAKNFQNGTMDHPFTGWGIENPNWYDGPLQAWPDTDNSNRVFSYLPMPAGDFPNVECGYQNTPAS